MKNLVIFLNQLGIDFKKIISVKQFPRYLVNLITFVYLSRRTAKLFPILTDFNKNAGDTQGQYFHQDLIVASLIYKNNPDEHLDIGSRIDGFVAHVASFRKIILYDIRPLPPLHKNIIFKKVNLQNKNKLKKYISISCLHAIEHFGLGRYGDPLDPSGHVKGFINIVNMMKKNGRLYISFPISLKNTIYFNAHRTFHPLEIFSWIPKNIHLKLIRFDYINDHGNVFLKTKIKKIKDVSNYGLGIYTFLRKL